MKNLWIQIKVAYMKARIYELVCVTAGLESWTKSWHGSSDPIYLDHCLTASTIVGTN